MTRPRGLVSGFTGSGAFELYLLGPVVPAIGYMGGKLALRSALADCFGLRPGCGADRVVFCDAGPWGGVWSALRSRRSAHDVADVLDGWAGSMRSPSELWGELANLPPYADEARRVAQFLWLQGRSASASPVWYEEGRGWRMSIGHADRNQSSSTISQRGRWATSSPGRCSGLTTPATVARRVRAVGNMLAGCDLRVVHGDISEAWALLPEDLSGWVVYLDPPYNRATRYAALCPRDRWLSLALSACERGAVVGISEGEPIQIGGWHPVDLSPARKSRRWTARQSGEWLTMSQRPSVRPAVQLRLGEAA